MTTVGGSRRAMPPTPDDQAVSGPIDEIERQAAARDAAAAQRDARAEAVQRELEADPHAHSALDVALRAAADRAAAAADRQAAAHDRAALARLAGRAEAAPPRLPALTQREMQVLERLAKAMSTRAIADDLILSPNSVKTHTQAVFRKIGVRSRAEAALWARDHGIG